MSEEVIVSKRYELCKIHLCISIISYIVICLFELEKTFDLMILYGLISFCMISLILKSELRYNGFSIIPLFLLGSYLRVIIPTIQNGILAYNGEQFKEYYDYTDAIFPTAISLNIYYMMFIIFLTFFSKKNRVISIDLNSFLMKKNILRISVFFYLWGFVYSIYSESFGLGFVGIFLDGFSQMSLLILAFASVYKKEIKYSYVFYLLVIIEVIRSSIWGFYKMDIIQPIFICCIQYYLSCKFNRKSLISLKSVTLVFFSIVFMLAFVYPFMTAKRHAAGWDPTNGVTKDINIKELVINVFENKDALITEGQGETMLDRFDALRPNAYFYKLVQIDGLNPIVLYASIRQYWPKWLGRDTSNDILLKPGYIVNSFVRHGRLQKLDDFSSGYIGSFSSGYYWGWWIGVVVVCIFNAFVISWLINYCSNYSNNYLCLLVLNSIILNSFNCFEEVHSGGLSRAIRWFMFIVLFKLIFFKKTN